MYTPPFSNPRSSKNAVLGSESAGKMMNKTSKHAQCTLIWYISSSKIEVKWGGFWEFFYRFRGEGSLPTL